MPVTFNSEIACRNTYLWYHKPKCSVDSWSTLSLRKNPPSLLKVPLETGHVLKPTTFLKFLFGGPNFLWENRTGGEFPLIIGPPARVVVENPMNPSLSIQSSNCLLRRFISVFSLLFFWFCASVNKPSKVMELLFCGKFLCPNSALLKPVHYIFLKFTL